METSLGSNDKANAGAVAELVGEGVLTRCRPSARQRADIAFALPIIRRLDELGIGRAIAVKEREVIAVETLEGTAAMVRRAGGLCASGHWLLMKIGGRISEGPAIAAAIDASTVHRLKEHGGSCLAVVAGCTLVLDKSATIVAAEQARIAIVGVAL